MRKLLRANFSRLFRDKLFLVSLALMFVMGTALQIMHYIDNVKNNENWTPNATCFVFAVFVPIPLSLITALFIGSDYSDGTMRNKLIVGHKRHCIYLANLIVIAAAGILLSISYILPHTVLGFLLFGGFVTQPSVLLLYTGVNFALMIAYSSLFVLTSMLSQSKANTTAMCILLAFVLLFVGVYLTSALNEPEYYSGYVFTADGVTTSEDSEKNPNYVGGKKREVYEFLQEFTPGGQELLSSNMTAENPAMLALYDGIILLVSTGVGIALFRRKDLK